MVVGGWKLFFVFFTFLYTSSLGITVVLRSWSVDMTSGWQPLKRLIRVVIIISKCAPSCYLLMKSPFLTWLKASWILPSYSYLAFHFQRSKIPLVLHRLSPSSLPPVSTRAVPRPSSLRRAPTARGRGARRELANPRSKIDPSKSENGCRWNLDPY